ncbi:MAG: hypothetical protein D6688_09090 [Alphaproteobacteria bacterium]|nr:MAG: hypothetical protein D6688_09090 [Alphaproteobacteria bacterium]
MRRRQVLTILAAATAVTLGGCAPVIPPYDGPEVTRLAVFKSSRRLYVFHDDAVLRAYDVALGFAPEGDKTAEGDGRTPEGSYVIDRKNPESDFYLSLGISYPNARDIEEARARGLEPGGDIFIHGQAGLFGVRKGDWTAGCIAVTNPEMRELYAMVPVGTPIDIYP